MVSSGSRSGVRLPSFTSRPFDPANRGSSGSLAIDHLSRAEAQSGAQIGYKPAMPRSRPRPALDGLAPGSQCPTREHVLGRLKRGWSPEQVAGWLAPQQGRHTISHETIYRFIYAQIRRTKDYSWRHYLPRAKAKRGRRGKRRRLLRRFIKGRVSLAQRPPERQRRDAPGHWEADLMLFASPGQAILVAHERTSRLLLSAKQPAKPPHPAADQPARLVRRRSPATAQHHHLRQRHRVRPASHNWRPLGIETFFCDPHSPWQKGGIENAIGRLRRFLPRKTDLAHPRPTTTLNASSPPTTTPAQVP